MDPRKLIYLATIIEHGSFKKAAKQLLVSQPALSTSIDRLERSLGGKLLDRSSSGVTPTPLGDVIYAHARLIRDEVERATSRVQDQDLRTNDSIAMGALPSLTPVIVPQAIFRWRKQYPDPTLRINVKIQLELLLALIRGELDFIIAQTEWYGIVEGLKQKVLFRDRLRVIARPDHPAFRLDKITWSALSTFPWVMQMMVGRHRTVLEKAFASESAEMPKRLTECGSISCLKALVAGSDSLALLPASAIASDVRDGSLRSIDMGGAMLNRDIALIYRDNLPPTPPSKDLIDAIAAVGLEVGDAGKLVVESPERASSAFDKVS